MSDFPEYFGILPARVRYDPVLSAGAKVLYADIGALCRLNGFCGATNGYFARLYGVSQTCVSLWISQLIRGGYVINTNESPNTESSKKEKYFKKTQNRCLKIVKRGLEKNLKQDNTDTQSIKTDTQVNKTPAMIHNTSLLDMLLAQSMEQSSVYEKKTPLSQWEFHPLKTTDLNKKIPSLFQEKTLKKNNKSELEPMMENESFNYGKSPDQFLRKKEPFVQTESMTTPPLKNDALSCEAGGATPPLQNDALSCEVGGATPPLQNDALSCEAGGTTPPLQNDALSCEANDEKTFVKSDFVQSYPQKLPHVREATQKSDFCLKATIKAFERCFGFSWGDKRVLGDRPFKNENITLLKGKFPQPKKNLKTLERIRYDTPMKNTLTQIKTLKFKIPPQGESLCCEERGTTPPLQNDALSCEAGGTTPPPQGESLCCEAGETTPPPQCESLCCEAGGTTPPPQGESLCCEAGGTTPSPQGESLCCEAGGTTPPPQGESLCCEAGGTTPSPQGESLCCEERGTTPPPQCESLCCEAGGTTPPPQGDALFLYPSSVVFCKPNGGFFSPKGGGRC